MPDYSTQIRQLSQARRDSLKAVEDMEAASKADGADRSHSIALLKRDVASYDKQLAGIEAKIKAEAPPPPPAKEEKKSPK